MDNLHDPDSALAARCSYFLYHGRADSYSACNSHYSGTVTRHSRTEGTVN